LFHRLESGSATGMHACIDAIPRLAEAENLADTRPAVEEAVLNGFTPPRCPANCSGVQSTMKRLMTCLTLLPSMLVTCCGQEPQSAGSQLPGRDVFRQAALENPGDPDAGKLLFEKDSKLTCLACHRITGMEKSGPNLDGIGDKYTRQELIDHILEPDREIKPGYEQAIIATTEGKVIPGRVERATKDFVRIIDANGKQSNVRTAIIDTLAYSPKSLMPDNVAQSVTPAQFCDLIAYLETLKFGIKQGLTTGGSPVEIPRLAEPVGFRRIQPEGFKFENPVWCGALPGAPGQILVVEHQTGIIWRLQKDAKKLVHARSVFLALGDEIHFSANQGLMGLAFHPNYTENGRYFLEYEVEEDGVVSTTIAERLASEDRLTDSDQPSRRLLAVAQPAFNHNGGCIEFGPDGMLYAAFGDGGPQKDPPGFAQNPGELLGSMIRIDVNRRDEKLPYAVPTDNPPPFPSERGQMTRPEVWAIGFREPWRFSFDDVTGDLWLGDVGQNKFEEICLVRKGDNHGWNVMEAFEPFSDEYRDAGRSYQEPLFAYEHGLGFSVTGGYVYRGNPASSFYGVYIFGDYNTKRVWGLRQEDGRLRDVREIGTAPGGIASFGRDSQGELLLVTYGGVIYQIDLTSTEYR